MQGLSAQHAAPAAPLAAQAPNLMELDDLLGPEPPAQGPPQPHLLGSFTQSVQLPGSLAGHAPQADTLLPPAAACSQTVGAAQKQPQQQQKVGTAAGPAPMAPRGNAAVEQSTGRQDPFADLFS